LAQATSAKPVSQLCLSELNSIMPPKAEAKPKAKVKKESKPKEEIETEENKVARPDKGAFDAESKGITEQIEKLQKELKALSSEISGKGSGKDEFFTQKAQIREKINNETAALNALHARREEIQGVIKASKDSQRAAVAELGSMKKELQFRSTEEIDQRIGTLEDKLMHESIPLKEEKKIMEEIKQLKKQKPKVSQMYLKEAQAKGSIEAAKQGRGNTKEELDLLWTEINSHKGARDKLYEDLKALQEERDAATGDVSGLFEQRDKLNEGIRAHIAKRNEIRDEFKSAENRYYEYEREQRSVRQEKAQAERSQWADEKKKADRQRKVDNLDNQPHTHEISLVVQTTKFCKTFLAKEAKVEVETKDTVHDNPDTHMVLASKKSRDDEYYYAPSKSKAKTGKAKKETGKQQIKHNAVTFKLFKELDLDAPITTDDIPEVLQKLEVKMQFYQDKIQEWEANREEMKRKIMAGEDIVEEAETAPAAAADEAGDAE